MSLSVHPILKQSFALIDQEVGEHEFSVDEYTVVQRVIHSTADFEFKHLLRFSPGVIVSAIAALGQGCPIITDVSMVKQGIIGLVQQTFNNPLISAVEQVKVPPPGKTRTETGVLDCLERFPTGIYVIGNAPTALLGLCQQVQTQSNSQKPVLVIGAPVGFVSVIEAKAALAQTNLPQVRVEGRKGGSPVAAAILNALLVLAWQSQQ